MRFLTGIKPSGYPHLGNYFGAIEPAIQLQAEGEAFYFIADYHAQTTVQDPRLLEEYVTEVALTWLACGLDPERAVFYRQSSVPEVQELTWYLSTVTPMGLLERCHSYKDAVAKGAPATHALFAYPVLMAADILLYSANAVPVGQDQKQHLEVTRDIAQKFNERYGEVLTVPEARIREDVARVPGLDGQKMSKSYDNTLQLFGNAKQFKKRVMSIKTDSTPIEEPKPTANSALIDLYKLVASEAELAAYVGQFTVGGTGYGDLKKQLLAKLNDSLALMRERYEHFADHPEEVRGILEQGTARARQEAAALMAKVRDAVGTTPWS
ncbi:MAG: tryptophan--tRNA ligase [Verrucomicrobiota bacterium]